MNFSSKFFDIAVKEVACLPGIGKKTALRLVLFLLRQPHSKLHDLSVAISGIENVKFCIKCHNISDLEVCEICSNTNRDSTIVCVVEDVRDVIAIENIGLYNGVYHVLGGKISPMEGVSPSDITIQSLVDKVRVGYIREVIFALSGTMEGDTTSFYIFKQLEEFRIQTSSISRGVAVGGELEYTDEITLAQSLENRVPYESILRRKS